jgi:subtilisin
MKVKLIIISIILLLIVVFASGCLPVMEKLGLVNPTNEEQLSPEKGGPPDGLVKLLIGFKEKPGPAQQAMVKGLGGKIKYTYNFIPAMAASIPETAIEALKKNPNITNIELDSKVYALDAELNNSWGVKHIGAGVVHESGNKGKGIKIAVIDTGIDYTHPDLNANYAGGYDFINLDSDPMDDEGHGTHVAGIIAAEDNGDGVVGVAPAAELYALKALDDTGSGYMSDVIFAIQWATDPNDDGSASDRLDIINMSLGGQKNIVLEWACNLAYLDGLLIVAAAGNGGAVDYPAAYSSVIAVSATDEYDNLASFSSTGKQIELAAPGVDINSTLPGNDYSGETWSGTSMASPHVAGTAALVWKANPGWSNDDVRTRLQETAKDLGAVGWDSKYGYGLVNAVEAVVVSGEEPPPEPETGTINIKSIGMRLVTQKRGKNIFVNAVALVRIVDDSHHLVEGATVSGTWSGATRDVDSGVTDVYGIVSLESKKVKNPESGIIFTFTVDDVTKSGWMYDSSANTKTSNSITVHKSEVLR